MLTLVAGLVLFLGAHSVRVFAEGWRSATIAQVGERTWKGVYSLVSIAGFVLIVVGFGLARQAGPLLVWGQPAAWTKHVTALFTLVAFVLVTAAYVPGNAIKARLGDPMILGVMAWAFGHLVANNTMADLLLFGGFLLWAVFDFRAARGRRIGAGGRRPSPQASPRRGEGTKTVLTVLIGVVAWAVFALWLHGPLIGVRPFAM